MPQGRLKIPHAATETWCCQINKYIFFKKALGKQCDKSEIKSSQELEYTDSKDQIFH